MAFFIFFSATAPAGLIPSRKHGRHRIFFGFKQIQDAVEQSHYHLQHTVDKTRHNTRNQERMPAGDGDGEILWSALFFLKKCFGMFTGMFGPPLRGGLSEYRGPDVGGPCAPVLSLEIDSCCRRAVEGELSRIQEKSEHCMRKITEEALSDTSSYKQVFSMTLFASSLSMP